MPVLLPYTYLGPIHFYSRIKEDKRVVLERHEHFRKQTFRNRCTIYGANGALDLTVPTLHLSGERSMDIREISYTNDWQKLHWKSLESAYRSSPFFEYYEDEFAAKLMNKYTLLRALNRDLMELALRIMDIDFEITETLSYEDNFSGTDLRDIYTPKSELMTGQSFKRYPQVFEDRHGFIPNLSIWDLIFNQGPRSKEFL
ncbi:MAG: WbqC family protein [Flavobacteriales bacterium]|nr:WbqC family protein [Flavobacteriales bacterium]